MEPNCVGSWATCPTGHNMLKKKCHILKINHQYWSATGFDLRTSIIFFIYMDDLPCASNPFHCILYADDTTLFSTIGYSIPLQNSNVNDQFKPGIITSIWVARCQQNLS